MGCTWRFTVTPNAWSAAWRRSAGLGAEGTSRFRIRKRPLPSSTKRARRSVGRGRATRFGARGLVEQQLPPVSVRVDFTITKQGVVRGVTASASGSGESLPLFEETAKETVSTWRCEPAARPYKEDDDAPARFEPVDYRTWVVLRFELEEGKPKSTLSPPAS